MHTTLNKILSHSPCGQERGSGDGWDKLLTYLGKTEADDEPLSLLTILESNGLDDAIWALRAVDGHDREMWLLACDCAEHVLHIYEREYPDDLRPRTAIEVARRYAMGEASEEELAAAWSAALAAAVGAVGDAWDAWSAAIVAAAVAAWDPAYAAAYTTTWNAWTAASAGGVAGGVAERDWQTKRFIQMCEEN